MAIPSVKDIRESRLRPSDEDAERRRQAGKALGDLLRARVREGYMRPRKRGKESIMTTKGAWYQIAHEAEIPYSSVWQFKEGMLLPGLKKLRRLCDVLKLNFDEARALYPDGHRFKTGRAKGEGHVKNWHPGRVRFAEKLREWLRRREIESGPRMEQFCIDCGIVEGYLRFLMRGKVNIPSWKVCRRMAKALQVKLEIIGAYKTVASAAPWMRPYLLAVLLPKETQLLQDTQDQDDQTTAAPH